MLGRCTTGPSLRNARFRALPSQIHCDRRPLLGQDRLVVWRARHDGVAQRRAPPRRARHSSRASPRPASALVLGTTFEGALAWPVRRATDECREAPCGGARRDVGWLMAAHAKKEAGSALPFTPRPAGVADVRSLDGGRERSRARAPRYLIHQATGLPKTTKREVQSRFPKLLVPKPAIQAVARHEAHLVVEGRPSGAAPFEAELDEVDRHLGDALVRQPHALPD